MANKEGANPIGTQEEWDKICGDKAEKDCLFLVEVYAAWCGPSNAILSTYKKLRMDFEGRKIKIMQVCRLLPTRLNS